MELAQKTREVVKARLSVPNDYSIVFAGSATECWEMIAQSLTRSVSQHFYNGSFGEKWFMAADALHQAIATPFDINEQLPLHETVDADVVCVTQNETSNGTQVDMQRIGELREKTDAILAIDATSSMAGQLLDFQLADVWYASVQKCFGLPAGMAVMILSPNAVKRAAAIADRKHYNSLLKIIENWENNQAPYTPNVLDLYLLYRSQTRAKPIHAIHKKLERRYEKWTRLIEGLNSLDWLVANEHVRSTTVLTLSHTDPKKLLEKAESAGFVFGKGYGRWKDTTIRMANFPAIKEGEIDKAIQFLGKIKASV